MGPHGEGAAGGLPSSDHVVLQTALQYASRGRALALVCELTVRGFRAADSAAQRGRRAAAPRRRDAQLARTLGPGGRAPGPGPKRTYKSQIFSGPASGVL
eukprot:5988472-Pyramimonas_sp.AAC.1